jgi:hypothetical protein
MLVKGSASYIFQERTAKFFYPGPTLTERIGPGIFLELTFHWLLSLPTMQLESDLYIINEPWR